MSDAPTFVRDTPTFTRDAPVGPLASAFDRILGAAREGYGSEGLPSILTPKAQQALETSPGIVNREINAPLARLAGTALAGMGGLFRGGQQAIEEATGNRDLAALPEAFMGSPGMLRAPRVPEPALPDISGLRLAPRTKLIDAPAPTETARAAPAPHFTRDPNQTAIPGTGPSAVQAQAARDAGRGTLHADVTQKPADEGLFDTNARKQRPLFTRD